MGKSSASRLCGLLRKLGGGTHVPDRVLYGKLPREEARETLRGHSLDFTLRAMKSHCSYFDFKFGC